MLVLCTNEYRILLPVSGEILPASGQLPLETAQVDQTLGTWVMVYPLPVKSSKSTQNLRKVRTYQKHTILYIHFKLKVFKFKNRTYRKG